ncbi:D-inositol 3-phosphate glycosyltransferase [Planctomycetes bacterium MalM25]|nr:D-inositol 3-phosphate glycosyltransferase [Planctomycetes bacterium MalM25]
MTALSQAELLRKSADATTAPGPSGDDPHRAGERRHVLQIAYACHPEQSMETRIGWRRALAAATRHEVTVLHGGPEHSELLAEATEKHGLSDRLRFVAVEPGPLGGLLNQSATTFYLSYRLWHRTALQTAKRLHAERAFDLVHQTTFCGFREPGHGWKLGAPFVWGPIGGTQAYPLAYLGQMGPRCAWIELCRNAINWWQLRLGRRVRRAAREAEVVVAATQQAARDIRPLRGADMPVQLETALDTPILEPKPPRSASEPFKILWAGRLRSWKTLPLLLKALPLLPADVDWRLRVLGVGSSERAWRRVAERLGVADRIEWLGWPEYRETLPHYREADAFAFTSMRDTSGTGLLEALAAGTPIVGVDHQGAADIMTTQCATPVPVGRPQDTIRGFATAITRLARDPDEWRRLSEGARARAESYRWDDQTSLLLDWYDQAWRRASSSAAAAQRASTAPNQDKLASITSSPHPSVG